MARGKGRQERRARRSLLLAAPERLAVQSHRIPWSPGPGVFPRRHSAQAPSLASKHSRSTRRTTVCNVAAQGGRRGKPKARTHWCP
jgi:hypothetical protein